MACDTFIKIAQKCRKQFVTVQVGEVWPFIEEILGAISTHICDLQPQQVRPAAGRVRRGLRILVRLWDGEACGQARERLGVIFGVITRQAAAVVDI